MYSLVKKQNKNITNKMINLFTLQTITNITNDYKWLQMITNDYKYYYTL